LTPVDNIL